MPMPTLMLNENNNNFQFFVGFIHFACVIQWQYSSCPWNLCHPFWLIQRNRKKSTHVGFSVDWSIRSFDFIYLHNSYYKAFAYVSHFFRSHEINNMFTHKKNIQMCVSRMNESRKNQKNKISIPIRTEGRWKRTFLLVDLSWHSDWCISVAHTWK